MSYSNQEKEENKLIVLYSNTLHKLFNKPHLSASFIVSIIFFIFTDACIILAEQPSDYWHDFKQAFGGIPYVFLSISPWFYILCAIIYIVLIACLIKLCNYKISLPIWVAISFCHLYNILTQTFCFSYRCFSPESYLINSIIIFSISLLIGVIILSYIQRLTNLAEQPIKTPGRLKFIRVVLGIIGFVWILLMSLIPLGMVINFHGWRKINYAGESPAPRIGGQIAYDIQRKKAVLFGGSGEDDILLNDTWEWNGYKWDNIIVNNSPKTRVGHAMAYDQNRNVLVLYGGHDDKDNNFSDTWEWNGNNWTLICHNCAPGSITGHRMVYDKRKEKIILYGGYKNYDGQLIFLNTAWEWDGEDWKILSDSIENPIASGFELSYDLKNERIIAFIPGCCKGTWIWMNNWEKLELKEEPSPRTDFGMVMDINSNILVLYGGIGDGIVFGDTWEFNGETWENANNDYSYMGKRWGVSMFYDYVRGRIIMFGGINGNERKNDIWEYYIN